MALFSSRTHRYQHINMLFDENTQYCQHKQRGESKRTSHTYSAAALAPHTNTGLERTLTGVVDDGSSTGPWTTAAPLAGNTALLRCCIAVPFFSSCSTQLVLARTQERVPHQNTPLPMHANQPLHRHHTWYNTDPSVCPSVFLRVKIVRGCFYSPGFSSAEFTGNLRSGTATWHVP